MSADVYTHGHHRSVVRSHARRTAATSAAYLLPFLQPGQRVLDVGCGPGSITVDLARAVSPGEVVGVDRARAAVDLTRDAAGAADLPNLSAEVADVLDLPFDDASFDVVHAHQVLQHVPDPVAALREMRRVTRPGGVVAVRDADYAATTWYPPSAGLDEWLALYHEVTEANRTEADAGRRLLHWALEAGFRADRLTPGASAWCFATPEDRAWWAGTWAERVTSSGFAEHALREGLADDVALESLAEAWREWGEAPDGWFAILHGELIARV
nr:methyltransferase domain-containing protein [Actinotalea sp. Marseille-Q4924]